MNYLYIIKNNNIMKITFENFLLENKNNYINKTIISVDIQPEYEEYISFNLSDWVDFINEQSNKNDIIFLYNGEWILGMIDEDSYKFWLIEHGVNEDVVYNATFYDKGYAFFRYCMDNNIDDDNIVDLLKFMMKHDINDTRDIDEDTWDKYIKETTYDQQDIRDLLESSDDMINIPDLMEFLDDYSNIILHGGGVSECLKEVEIALLSLEKDFEILTEFTY